MAENDMGDANLYEFDAPSHVVDLKELEDDKSQDKWFEEQAARDCQLFTPLRPDPLFVRNDKDKLPRAAVPPHVKRDVESGPSTSPLPNIVTSWGTGASVDVAGARPKQTTGQPPAQPRRVSKRKSASSVPAAPPVKKYKKTPVTQRAKKSTVASRNGQPGQTTRNPSRNRAVACSTNTGQSTSEEQELERIRNLQREVALHRKKNEASYKAALAGNPPPKKTAMSTTVPKEFRFNTDTRVKASSAASNDHKEVDFINLLRKPSSPAKAAKGATVPKPFNLSTGSKRKLEEPGTYVPVAQQVELFYRKTPERYHLRSRQHQERGPSPVKRENPKLTQPQMPHLLTQKRSRLSTAKSSTDLEAEEAEKLNQFKFKALELNRKILEGTETLKKPAVKEPTVPEGFELQVVKRLKEKQTTKKSQDTEEKLHTFHAQPLPKKILEGVVEKQPSPVKAPPVPHFGLPFQPLLSPRHHVGVCPFSFEEREREKRTLREKRLEEERNEAPKFRAQPLPDFSVVVLPEKKKLEPTKPEPFKLLVDERGAMKNRRLEQIIQEERKHQEEVALFKARPNTVIHKEPFQPKREGRSTVAVEAFELSTERRAQERQEFERLASEKEALRALMEEEQRREEEQREKEEIARLRQEQVHKAQPVRHYKTLKLKKSEVPLTVPLSPNFSDRFRL
ncbi:targeting protein for Xklp2-like isoform X2 [Sphaeramia orbicularis]|uniref:targeting protein for Xklp2-like isoform X2 n=1 Tax=Sphaeramia orbicularis TaxID=375764 RepID=UPI0011811A5B|nr:targeting protein for Xklp2-like isoform X2 [Sphaeramia orbicularis]